MGKQGVKYTATRTREIDVRAKAHVLATASMYTYSLATSQLTEEVLLYRLPGGYVPAHDGATKVTMSAHGTPLISSHLPDPPG